MKPGKINLLKRRSAKRLNQVWVADIIYIRLQNEFVYLAVKKKDEKKKSKKGELTLRRGHAR